MPLPDRLHRAIQKLNGALDNLDLAVARRAEVDASRADIDQEFAVMQDDRFRLALDLDAALARTRVLDRTAEEVSERLRRAGDTVRSILAGIEAEHDSLPASAPAKSHDPAALDASAEPA